MTLDYSFLRHLPLPLSALLSACLCVSCTTLHQDTKSPEFQQKLGHFTYAEVKAINQSGAQSCGAACLSCVLHYWEKPTSEKELLNKYPARGKLGYPLSQLQEMALAEGLDAFGLDMTQTGAKPAAALSSHIQAGRPVIVAVKCPVGRYFGDPVPFIENLDRRSVHPFGLGEVFKHHYVVVCGESSTHWLVMDPAYGLGTVQKQPLLDWWKDEQWAALVCSPKS